MKKRLSDLIKKILSIKILVGVVLTTVLLGFGFLDPTHWVAVVMFVLGGREISKKFENRGK